MRLQITMVFAVLVLPILIYVAYFTVWDTIVDQFQDDRVPCCRFTSGTVAEDCLRYHVEEACEYWERCWDSEWIPWEERCPPKIALPITRP